MNDDITVREIALWALRLHREEIGDYLDLSDDELQKIFEGILNDGPLRRVFRERMHDKTRKELAKLGTDPYRTPEEKQREADIDAELEDIAWQYGDEE